MPVPDRRRRITAFVVAIAVLIATPLVVVAADAFTDVPNENVHHDDITWLADAGVTLGCNPPANTEFCPGDPVLRQQMASFLRRLAENQVVDAATAVEAEHAATAGDAETVGGIDPTGLLLSNGAARLFAAAHVSSLGTLTGAIGPVESVEPISEGEHRVTFGENFRAAVGDPAFIQVSSIHIAGNTCSWRFDGGSLNSIRTVCNTAAGALADTSHSILVIVAEDLSPNGSGELDPTEGN